MLRPKPSRPQDRCGRERSWGIASADVRRLMAAARLNIGAFEDVNETEKALLGPTFIPGADTVAMGLSKRRDRLGNAPAILKALTAFFPRGPRPEWDDQAQAADANESARLHYLRMNFFEALMLNLTHLGVYELVRIALRGFRFCLTNSEACAMDVERVGPKVCDVS